MKRTLFLVSFIVMLGVHVSSIHAQAPSPVRGRAVVPLEIVERRCPTVIVYERGVSDSFAAPADPVFPSLAMDAFLHTLPGFPPVAYDENVGCDHAFGDSFKVDACVLCCGLCSATLEITVRGCGSALDCNDSITIGQAPFGVGNAGYVLWNGYIDPNGCPDGVDPAVGNTGPPATERAQQPVKPRMAGSAILSPTIVKKIVLDPRKVAELVCNRKVTELDVYVQDDQSVDSMRLIITKP